MTLLSDDEEEEEAADGTHIKVEKRVVDTYHFIQNIDPSDDIMFEALAQRLFAANPDRLRCFLGSSNETTAPTENRVELMTTPRAASSDVSAAPLNNDAVTLPAPTADLPLSLPMADITSYIKPSEFDPFDSVMTALIAESPTQQQSSISSDIDRSVSPLRTPRTFTQSRPRTP